MRKTLLYIFLLLVTWNVKAQYRWDIMYNFCPDTLISGYPFTAYPDSSFILVAGNTFSSSKWGLIPFLASFDYTGQLIWKKYLYHHSADNGYFGYENIEAIKPYSNGKYVTILNYEDASIHPVFNMWQPYLHFFDKNGDSIRTIYYRDSSRFKYFHGLVVDANHHIVAMGRISSEGYHPVGSSYSFDSSAIWIVKMDTSGNMLWEKKYYETSTVNDNAGYVEPLNIDLSADKQHYILFCAVKNFTTGLWEQNLAIKTDLDGNVIWQKWIPLKYWSNVVHSQIISLRNGGYAFSSSYSVLPDSGAPNDNKLYYGKLDEQGNILWTKTFDPFIGNTEGVRVVERHNGDLIFLGRTVYWNYYPFLVKTDANGVVLWHRTYKRTPPDYIDESLYTLHETFDNRLLLTGGVISGGKQPGFDTAGSLGRIILLDSMGCLVPDCQLSVNIMDDHTSGITIYPNPTNGNFTIKTTENGTLHIYDLHGRQLASYHIDTEETHIALPATLAPGVYMAKFINTENERTVIRLMYQP